MFKLLLFSLSLYAEEGHLERSLLRANTLTELKHVRDSRENLEILRRGCEYELKKQKIPRHCYELSSKEKTFELNKLDDLCVRYSKKQTRIQEQGGVSRICASAVESRNAEIRYTESEKNPIQILRKE